MQQAYPHFDSPPLFIIIYIPLPNPLLSFHDNSKYLVTFLSIFSFIQGKYCIGLKKKKEGNTVLRKYFDNKNDVYLYFIQNNNLYRNHLYYSG